VHCEVLLHQFTDGML